MKRRKRILVLTPRFPYPVVGGDRLRIYQMCKELSKQYELTLLSLCEKKEEMEAELPLDNVFSHVERIHQPAWRSRLQALFALPSRMPLQVAYFHNKEFEKRLNDLIPSHDCAVAHLIRAGSFLIRKDIPKVLEMTDAISLNYERVSKIARAGGWKNIAFSIERSRLKVYEKSIVDNFDLSVLISQVDKDYLFADCGRRRDDVIVCSNGVDVAALPVSWSPSGNVIAFIGNMESVQNLDAASWFATKIFPLVREKGDFEFRIVGRIRNERRDYFNKLPGVVATGAVANVAEAVRGAFVGVCPVRLGAGVQNKVLEYMSLGLPVVSTATGVEGINVTVGKHVLVADSPAGFAESIIQIKANSRLSKALSADGRSFVEENHDWSATLAPFVESVDRLLGSDGDCPAAGLALERVGGFVG